METNKIYNQDCLEFMKALPEGSIDLIVTSPPYNKGAYYSDSANKSFREGTSWARKIDYDNYSDDMKPEDYEKWQRAILNECLRVLKPSGSIFYNHKDILVNKLIVAPKWVYDFPIHQQIIWERNGSPAQDNHYFCPITEYIYWIVKDKNATFFEKDKAIYKNTIWKMIPDRNPHPAPFPLYMAENIIACSCPQNGVVYDPFMGSGTTALATIRTGGGERVSRNGDFS